MAATVKTATKPAGAAVKREPEQYTAWAEIKKTYPHHWILVENPVFDEDNLTLKKGILLCSSEKREDISKAIRERGNSRFSVAYTGEREKRLFLL